MMTSDHLKSLIIIKPVTDLSIIRRWKKSDLIIILQCLLAVISIHALRGEGDIINVFSFKFIFI